MPDDAITTMTGKYAINIGSRSWRERVLDKPTNIASSFRAAGMWTLYFPAMQLWLKKIHDGGMSNSE